MIENLHRTIRNLYPSAVGISGDSELNIIAKDSDGNEVTLNWTSINAKRTELQTEYDSLAYARSRKQEYDKLNQWEMQFDDQRDGTTTWVDSINEIKNKFPKE